MIENTTAIDFKALYLELLAKQKSDNLLLRTDVYKLGHMIQYAPGTSYVYSYLCARSAKNMAEFPVIGLQYVLMEYLSKPILPEHAEEFIDMFGDVLGGCPEEVQTKVRALAQLGYLPIKIKAVREGEVVPVKNALLTITNTHPDFPWVVGFVESLLLKVWSPFTTAGLSFAYRKVVEKHFNDTVDGDLDFLKDFSVHDFGYRGAHSEEDSAVTGFAHLGSFVGSDTITAYDFAKKYYKANPKVKPVILSVPASEHSVMCSFGRDGELDAYKNMLRLYPTGLVSIVSDTYDIWNVLTNFVSILKDDILARDGKVVFRPDSGNPEYIICGDPNAPEGTPAAKGCVRLLDEMFGSTVNSKGYKVLNPKVGLIYGDGMYLERYERTLNRLKEMGYAACNLVIGVGGILRNGTRDTLGFAIKATYVVVNGEERAIAKDPITDPGKKSHMGFVALLKDENGEFYTKDNCTAEEEETGFLEPVFENGKILRTTTLEEIRDIVRAALAA